MRHATRKSKEIADSLIKDGEVNFFKSSHKTVYVKAFGHYYLIEKAHTENPIICQLDGGGSNDVV